MTDGPTYWKEGQWKEAYPETLGQLGAAVSDAISNPLLNKAPILTCCPPCSPSERPI